MYDDEEFSRLSKEMYAYAEKEHLLKILLSGEISNYYYLKLKDLFGYPEINGFFPDEAGDVNKELNRQINNLVDRYANQDRGLALSDKYSKVIKINLSRREIIEIADGLDKTQPVVCIPYLDTIAVIPSFYFINFKSREGNPEKQFELIEAHSIVCLRKDEIENFVKEYAEIFDKFPEMIKKAIEDSKLRKAKEEAEERTRDTLKIIFWVIGGIVGLILLSRLFS